ncbi:hypothetical protein ACIRD9_41320 [Streptomyces violaceus]|uniref:hypothetical protein n=1 Tax=Streptomyces violaceus TaxID=1936 RepID=UPI00381DFE4F
MTTPAPDPDATPEPRRSRDWQWVKTHVVGPVLAAAIGAGITVVGVLATNQPTAAAALAKPSGSIERADPRGRHTHMVLSGTLKNMPKGYALWPFVEDSRGNYFPNFKPCTVEAADAGTGTWVCPELHIAQESYGEERFRKTLHVALVTADGANAIGLYRQSLVAGGKFEPPAGTTAREGYGLGNMTIGSIEIDHQDILAS